jgi:hypothetical protein
MAFTGLQIDQLLRTIIDPGGWRTLSFFSPQPVHDFGRPTLDAQFASSRVGSDKPHLQIRFSVSDEKSSKIVHQRRP